MKNWGGLILCFLLSAATWLVFSMSQTYSQIINIPVLVSSDITGHSKSSSREITIAARCSAVGYSLIKLNLNKDAVPVFIDASSLKQLDGDSFLLPQASVIKYSDRIFGAEVKVESVLSEDMVLTFPSENYVKVPVILNKRLTYHRQYMSPRPATTSPDSVLVYGTPDNIKGIESVETEVVLAHELKNDIHGSVKLKIPALLRTSQTSVEYNIPVCRYVDVNSSREVKAINVPDGVDLLVLPLKVSVKLQCYFPVDRNPLENLELYIDYREFESSLSGKCRVKSKGLSDNVIKMTLEPEFCSCIQNIQ